MDRRPTPLPPGTRAPDFTLPRSEFASVSLGDFRGRRAILVFYPADWEPVSREQLALYQEHVPAFRDLRAEVVGISTDGIWCHRAFAEAMGVRFLLLSDSQPKGAAARAYGVYPDGAEACDRALFVVDERGLVRWSQLYPTPVNPGTDGILSALEAMEATPTVVIRTKPGRDPGAPYVSSPRPHKEEPVSSFTRNEIEYLGSGLLGRLATVGRDGTPHVAPVGFSYNADLDTIDVGGHDLPNTKKFRDAARTGRGALVADDLASTDPWRPRGVEVRGRAEAVGEPRPLIRIHPERIVSWGIDDTGGFRRNGRSVG